ncbi:MAG: glycosyltransferase family 2 protein [Chitinophagales bacterium]
MEDRIPLSPPKILPIREEKDRPIWSVMIPSYNCSNFLVEAIDSVLSQDPGPEKMQIEVVDDCSTDADLEEIVERLGKGRIKLFRQNYNRGSLRNFETCLNRARGYWIHLLHADDKIKPGFYKEIESLFTRFPQAGAAFTNFSEIDDLGNSWDIKNPVSEVDGIIQDWLYTIGGAQMIQPPAMVVKREVYEKLGSYYAVHYGEDWEMWVRIAASFPVAHSTNYLAIYRIHPSNITNSSFLSGQSISDIQKVISLIGQYFPESKRNPLREHAIKHFSKYFARYSDRIYHLNKKPRLALTQAKRAFAMNANSTTLFFLLKMYVKVILGYKQ